MSTVDHIEALKAKHASLEHAISEELAGLLQPSGVVRQKNFIDDVRQLLLARKVFRLDTFARHILLLVRTMLLLQPIGHFGDFFAITDSVTFGSSHIFQIQVCASTADSVT